MKSSEPLRYENAGKVPESAWVTLPVKDVPPGSILMATKDGRFQWVKPEPPALTVLEVLGWIGAIIAFGIGICAAADLFLKRMHP